MNNNNLKFIYYGRTNKDFGNYVRYLVMYDVSSGGLYDSGVTLSNMDDNYEDIFDTYLKNIRALRTGDFILLS